MALTNRITRKTKELGADDAGVCLASDLLSGPTHRDLPLPEGIENHHCILVLALNHPPDVPELDYYVIRDGARFGNTEGNRLLMDISEHIGQWLNDEGIASRDLHYYVERGGVFLKGAAVLAGLGTIGMNNLFIHPGYGPRIRLRAHLVETSLSPSTPLDFNPCTDCNKPCLDVCPEKAFDETGETGYKWDRCHVRMVRNFTESVILPADEDKPAAKETHCCRMCELSCSYVGSSESNDWYRRHSSPSG
jgi:epoxyqueuosine reductase